MLSSQILTDRGLINIQFNILKYLSIEELCCAALVCKSWQRAIYHVDSEALKRGNFSFNFAGSLFYDTRITQQGEDNYLKLEKFVHTSDNVVRIKWVAEQNQQQDEQLITSNIVEKLNEFRKKSRNTKFIIFFITKETDEFTYFAAIKVELVTKGGPHSSSERKYSTKIDMSPVIQDRVSGEIFTPDDDIDLTKKNESEGQSKDKKQREKETLADVIRWHKEENYTRKRLKKLPKFDSLKSYLDANRFLCTTQLFYTKEEIVARHNELIFSKWADQYPEKATHLFLRKP